MNFLYFPNTDKDIRDMLDAVGADSLDELYSDVPAGFIYGKEFDIPSAMSEMEVRRYFDSLEERNRRLTVFCGCGAYDHYIPAVIPYITSRAEFLTAYTPYQAEISQGTLRYIFEFQSYMAELSGMDCANASMYDGATSAAEAVMMAVSASKKKRKVLVSDTLLPEVRKVLETYSRYHGINLVHIPHDGGNTSYEALRNALSEGDVAAVLVPGVNRFGIIEDLSGFSGAVHESKAFMIIYSDPLALAVIKSPREWGADIVCGEAQSLGIPLGYGGPYLGFIACSKELLRKMPGRVVGASEDMDGKRAFVLTLQAREQHIRREKATSNICSNQSLMALTATVYVSLMGLSGLRRVNDLSYGGAHYLYSKLLETGLFRNVFDRPFLNEFVLESLIPPAVLSEALLSEGYFAACETEEGYVSFCVTEKRTKEEIDGLVRAVVSAGKTEIK